MKAYYFGCIDCPGHFWFDINLKRISKPFYFEIDNLFCPENKKEGLAQIVYIHPNQYESYWTIVSFFDQSIDFRSGSNSNFIFEGIFNFDDSVDLIKKIFPNIYNRYKFNIDKWII